GGKLGLVGGEHIGQLEQADGGGGIGGGRIEDGGHPLLAGQLQCRLVGFHRRYEMGQQLPALADHALLPGNARTAERCLGTGAVYDRVAAACIDIDARSAGRLVAGLGHQGQRIVPGQLARQRATGVVAQGADEGGAGTGTAGGNGLVEALATRAGAVTPGNGGPAGGQGVATPDVVDIGGTGNYNCGHGSLLEKGSAEMGQHTGDGGRHQGGDGTAEHGAQAKLGQV